MEQGIVLKISQRRWYLTWALKTKQQVVDKKNKKEAKENVLALTSQVTHNSVHSSLSNILGKIRVSFSSL